MRNIVKNHYGSIFLLIFFIKALIFSISFSESVIFGCLTIFAGFQSYLYHLRLHTYHQKQINVIKKDIHQLKAISNQIKSINHMVNSVSKIQETSSTSKSSWSGL